MRFCPGTSQHRSALATTISGEPILHLLEFVDEFRRAREVSALEHPSIRGVGML